MDSQITLPIYYISESGSVSRTECPLRLITLRLKSGGGGEEGEVWVGDGVLRTQSLASSRGRGRTRVLDPTGDFSELFSQFICLPLRTKYRTRFLYIDIFVCKFVFGFWFRVGETKT